MDAAQVIWLCCRWQALSRSLERVTAVHGDEGDDQHGLKVHEVHDMQPGVPISHRVDTASAAVGLLPLMPSPRSKSGDSAPREGLPEEPGLRSSTCAAELADATAMVQTDMHGTALKLPVAVDSAVAVNIRVAVGQRGAAKADAGLQQSAAETASHGVIDLCSQEEHQGLQPQLPEHHTSQLPGDDSGTMLLECSTMDRQPHSQQPQPSLDQAEQASPSQAQQLELSLDSAEQVSLSQAGKADLAEVHDLRPAGTTLDPAAEYLSHIGSKPGVSAQQPTSRNSVLSGNTAQQLPSEAHAQANAAPHAKAHAEAHAQAGQLVQQLACKSGGQIRSNAQSNGQGEQQPQGMRAHIKALLRRQEGGGGGEAGKEAGGCEAAQALTQAEVIEAQTADQEKPSVSLQHAHL